MKIRTPSSAQSEQLIALGATPIDMPAGQIYNSIERGVVDGALISMAGAIDFKLLEVCRYFTIECLEEIMKAANLPIPEDPGRDVEASQQSWDKKPPKKR